MIDLGSRLDDFMDSAAVMTNLDLVITPDTSVAHLAGALGVPVWVALPFAPTGAGCWIDKTVRGIPRCGRFASESGETGTRSSSESPANSR